MLALLRASMMLPTLVSVVLSFPERVAVNCTLILCTAPGKWLWLSAVALIKSEMLVCENSLSYCVSFLCALFCLAAPGAQVLKAGMTQLSLSHDLGAAPLLTAPRLLRFGLVQVLFRVLACMVSDTRSLASLVYFKGHRWTKAFRNGLSLSLLPW